MNLFLLPHWIYHLFFFYLFTLRFFRLLTQSNEANQAMAVIIASKRERSV